MKSRRSWLWSSAVLLAACSSHSSGPSPDSAVPAANAIPLATLDGSLYTASVTIGAQTFALDIDTGSTTSAVAATACTSCGVTPLYAAGTGAMDTGKKAMTQYGDGSQWSGEVFSDKMGLAHNTPTVGVSFAAITSQTDFFGDTGYEGILGLGPADLLETGTTAYMSAAAAAGSSTKLAFELCPATGGKMWVGDYDTGETSGPAVTTPLLPVATIGYYAVELDDIGVDGTSLGFGSATYDNPLLDTGTSLFYVPGKVIDALVAKVNASAGRAKVFGTAMLGAAATGANDPCQGFPSITAATATAALVDANLPKLTMTFGGKATVSMLPSLSYLADVGGGEFCLVIADGGQNGSILGDVFLQSFVTSIDPVGQVVGFAPEKGCDAATTTHVARPRTVAEHGHLPSRP